MNAIDSVVCVHGIWSRGFSLALLKRRLEREYGYRVRLFDYPSVRRSLDDNAKALADFLAGEGLAASHIVGHSLGGVVALRMLADGYSDVAGRIVCLGSPLTGSRTADRLNRRNWGAKIVGTSLGAGVLNTAAAEWASDVCRARDVGVIAGTLPLGIGRLFAKFDEENDGTVAVSETRLPGARDHIVMPVSHSSMLVSRAVADQAAAFLKRGTFLRD